MNTSKNTIAKNVKGNKANDLTTISEMTNNFYPNANFRVLESLVLFWTSKVVFWRRRPDFTDVNTCQYIHTGTSDFRSEFLTSKTSGALIGRAACFHESLQTWLWRQDVLLFARHLARGLELEKKFKLSWKLDKFALFTYSFVSWNLENLYKDFLYKTSRLVRISLLISATTRSFAGFFLRGN